jgi:DNA-binding response OmpR family regulator
VAVTGENAPLILYVEDDPALLDLSVAALEEGGFRVEAVQTGADAARELEKPDMAVRALVTDINLPGGATGWDVARRARELFPDIAVIYVSGGSSHDWTSRGVPGSVMLTKPFALAQLVVAVSNATLGPQSDASTNT